MKGFIGGIVAMTLALVLGLLFALMGFVNMLADNPPSKMETALAGHAMDASVARAAPKLTNPVAADEASLVAGARLYRDHCALCHGDPVHPKSPLVGIRWTAMPGWRNVTVYQICCSLRPTREIGERATKS